MADEVTRLITRLETQGFREHDAALQASSRLVDDWGKKANGSFNDVGQGAELAGAKISSGIGSGVAAASASFSSFSSTAQGAFNSASQAGITAGGSITTSMGQAAASVAQVPSAISTIGPAATQMGGQVTAATGTAFQGLSQLGAGAVGAGASVSALSGQILNNKAAIASYTTEILNARSQQAELSARIVDATAKFGPYSQTVRGLQGEYKQLSAATRGLVTDKAQLVHETRGLETSLKAANATTSASVGATRASAQGFSILSGTVGQTGAATEGATKGFDRMTTMIRTQGTIFQGFDGVLQGLIGSMGGVTVATATLITLGGVLIKVIWDQVSAKAELVKLDKQQIETNLALTSVIDNLKNTATGLTIAMIRQADAQAQIKSGDFTATLLNFAAGFDKVKESESEVIRTNEKLIGAQMELQRALHSGRDIIEVYDAAGRKLFYDLDQGREVLQEEMAAITLSSDAATSAANVRDYWAKKVQESSVSLQENQGELNKNIELLALIRRSTGESASEFLKHASSVISSKDALDRLAFSLDGVAQATVRLNNAYANLKIPAVDVMVTTQGMNLAQGDLRDQFQATYDKALQYHKGLGDLNSVQKAHTDAVLGNLPALNQLNQKERERIANEAQLQGHLLNKKQIESQLKSSLVELTKEQVTSTASMAKARLEAIAIEEQLHKTAKAVKEVKVELDKNSPFIGEKAFAIPTESLDKAIKSLGARIGPSLSALTPEVQGEFSKWLSGVVGNVSAASGRDKGFFAPLLSNVQGELDEFSVRVSLGLNKIQAMLKLSGQDMGQSLERSVAKSLLEIAGLNEQALIQLKKHAPDAFKIIMGIIDENASNIASRMKVFQEQLETQALEAHAGFIRALSTAEKDTGQLLVQTQLQTLNQMQADNQAYYAALAGKVSSAHAKQESDLERHLRAMTEETRQGNLEVLKQYGDLSSGIDNQLKFVSDVVAGRFDQMSEQSIRANYQAAQEILQTWVKFHPELQGVLDQLPDSMNRSINKMKELGIKGATETTQGMIDRFAKLETGLDDSMNRVIAVIAIGMGKAKDVATGKMADMVRSVHDVISTMPGDIGEQLRRGENEFTKWFRFLDAGVKLVQLILGKQQTGIAGVLADIIGVNQKATTAAQTSAAQQTAALQSVNVMLEQSGLAWDVWADGVVAANQKAAGSIQGGAGGTSWLDDVLNPDGSIALESKKGGATQGGAFAEGFLGQVAGIAGGISAIFAGHKQGGIGGALTGALGGATAGAQIGTMIMPGIGTAIGAIGGAAIGFLAGIFGGGKSELQKAQEAAQLQQARDAIKISQAQRDKTLEEYKQSLLETASKAEHLMDEILGHVKLPRSQMRAFFKDFNLLMSEFAKHMEQWKEESLPKAKGVAEAESAIADALSKAPVVFDGIRNHVRLVEKQLIGFIDDYGLVITVFGQKADEIPNRLEKDAKKFAKRTGDVWEVIGKSGEAGKAILGTKLIDPTDVRNWGINVETQINALAEVFDHVDKAKLRLSGKLSQSGLDTLNFAGSAGEAIRKAIGTPSLSTTDVQNLFSGIRVIFAETVKLASEIEPESQAAAKALADAGGSVLGLFKSAGELGGSGTPAANLLLIIEAEGAAIKQAIVIGAQLHHDVGGLLTAEVVTFAKDADTVASMFGNVGKSFADAALTRDIYPATVDNIANGIELAIRGIAALRARVGSEMLAQSLGAAEGINAALSVVTNAGTAFKDLGIDDKGNPRIFSIQVVDNLISITEYAVNRVATLAKSVDKGDLTAAVEFSTTTRQISTNMADGLGFIKAVAEQAPTAISSFDAMVNNVVNFDTALSRSLDAILHARQDAATFRLAAADTKTDVLAGLQDLGITVAAAAGAVTSGLSGQSFGAQSVGPSIPVSPIPPSVFVPPTAGTAASSATQQPIVVYVTVQGSVYDKQMLQDEVVEAIQEAKDRNRI